MKSLVLSLVAGATAAALTLGAALAQDPRFDAADANGDGMVTLAELQAAFPDVSAEQFMEADADGNGALDREEFAALTGG